MICKRCRIPLVRVVNSQMTAHATCNRCNNYVECAVCTKCGNTCCLKCYNKPPPKPGGGPLISSEFNL
jgi:hypothetical protein